MVTPGFLSYHEQRLRRCRVGLLAWLRRWGAYLAAAAALLTLGTNSPLAILAAALGALVLPLLAAAQTAVQTVQAAGLSPAGAWAQVLAAAGAWAVLAVAVLGYALVGTLPLLLTRPLWWPARWAMAERALPLSPQVLYDSDCRMLAWVLVPTQALPWAGALALGIAKPALWAQGGALALLALATASGLAAVLGLAGMQRLRRRSQRQPVSSPHVGLHAGARDCPNGSLTVGVVPGGVAPVDRVPSATPQSPTAPLRPVHALRVLLWWPLRRGVARRTAHGLIVGGLATPALAAGPLMTPPAQAGWWLAALALVALASTAWLRARSRDELVHLWQACLPLPLRPAALNVARQRLCLLPASAGLLVAAPVLLYGGARPAVLLAWLAAMALACWREARPPPPAASHHAARWLFSLVLAVSLGSEVMP